MLTFNNRGILFPGIHIISWENFIEEYSFSSRRIYLFTGMKKALLHFKQAGCSRVYIDGSFVSKKTEPGDYDACWDSTGVDFTLLDPIFHRDLRFGTLPQKIKYLGEFFPAGCVESASGITFLDFFQTDKSTGNRKGIIQIGLDGVR